MVNIEEKIGEVMMRGLVDLSMENARLRAALKEIQSIGHYTLPVERTPFTIRRYIVKTEHGRNYLLNAQGIIAKTALEGGVLMNTDELAEKIAKQIFYHNLDAKRKEQLTALLKEFANEIHRRSIEP